MVTRVHKKNFLTDIIHKYASYSPQFSIIIVLGLESKKDVGVYSSAPIPKFRPSHCPYVRISNASQPTSSDIIIPKY